MGMQDRDYYREWLKDKDKKAQPLRLRWAFPVFKNSEMHPVLSVLLTVAISAGVYGVVKLVSMVAGLIGH